MSGGSSNGHQSRQLPPWLPWMWLLVAGLVGLVMLKEGCSK